MEGNEQNKDNQEQPNIPGLGPTREDDVAVMFKAKTDQNIAKISDLLNNSKGYMIAITVFDGRGGLRHVYVREDFPRNDMLDSLAIWDEKINEDYKDSRPK